MKILTAAETREVDRRTTEEFGIPGVLLMENAGMRVVEALAERVEDLGEAVVLILCGKGNNGGDGLVVARQLMQRGCFPSVFLFASPETVSGDARINLDILTQGGHPPSVIEDSGTWIQKVRDLGPVDVVVDALLGTGLTRPVDGLLKDVIGSLDEVCPQALVVAVDLPSGCLADTGTLSGPTVEADLTVTMTSPKLCLVLPPASECAGDVVVADIGNPQSLVEASAHRIHLLMPDSFPDLGQRRDEDTHKGDYGKVLVVGGSTGKSGAPAMTGEAALRAGAGLVTVASPRDAVLAVATYMPELMTWPLPATSEGTCARTGLEDDSFNELLESASVVVIGPGLGRHEETCAFARELVSAAAVPTIIDADGLYAFRDHEPWLREQSQPIVITPHAGEMAGLLGVSTDEVVGRRLDIAREFAGKNNVHVVLKGYRTVIAIPDGRGFVNPTGNAGMATAGSGDVLAGVIAGLLGQLHLGGFETRLCLAVYLHGLAGDIGAEIHGEEALTATDLTALLADAWARARGEPAAQ